MPSRDDPTEQGGVLSRRSFIHGAAVSAVTLPVAAQSGHNDDAHTAEASARKPDAGSELAVITLRVNGQPHTFSVDPRATLLDALRDNMGLTGTKKGCGHGQCGACTVHADGERVLSCMMFALMAEGREITTIEGLASTEGELHPMQQAFIDQDAFQCGYCTPGQIMSAIACVHEGHADDTAAIREYMSGNICRCAAYPNIVAAIEQAKTRMRKS
jgi:xanthine dehydrogenase YagT iron-sulfur-binding subunit